MSDDKEVQVRLQFLEEAQEYLDNIESGLLGLGSGKVNSSQIDSVLRAAHSIKGGAAMMGFQELSHLAHRLEDFFKVLKIGKSKADGDIEAMLLSTVDFLRQIINSNRQRKAVDSLWFKETVEPVFQQLHHHLGDPQPEDAAALLSSEVGEDMSTLIFETEVEDLLQKLEASAKNADSSNLSEELFEAAQELSGLGEMLELEAFRDLCNSVIEQLETIPEEVELIAELAIQEWRRSQALVLIGQTEVLPRSLDLNLSTPEQLNSFFESESDFPELPDSTFFNVDSGFEQLPDSSFIGSLLDSDDLEKEAFELFSSLEDVAMVEMPEIASEEITAPETHIPMISLSQPGERSSSFHPNLTSLPSLSEPVTKENTIRVAVKQLEELNDLFGEIAIEKSGLSLRLKSLRHLVSLLSQRIKTLEDSNFRLRIAYDKVATEMVTILPNHHSNLVTKVKNSSVDATNSKYFDSLEMDSYSDIHLLSQEVMETIVQIQEVSKDIEINLEDTDKNARHLNRTTNQMQTTITRVRMRPISDLLDRFPRALRDMEMQYGKRAKLVVRGSSTLIDRSILEALNDPLMHLFRNAFDHGIEKPAARLANGKPEQGTITISASHRGNQTIVTVSDDGNGINLEKIQTKAMSIGVSAEDLLKAKEEELLELIFEPGFSTAQEVTDLSGRGVGMDVVRTNIEEINGTIKVDTNLGVGTTFTIAVPFTLSVVRVLLVESNGMLLAFPTNIVEEMLVLDSRSILQAAGQEVLNWDGFIVRLIRLHEWLKLPFGSNSAIEIDDNPTIEEPTVLMIAQNKDLVGILVDRYWQEQEVTVRSVEGNIPLPPGFTGCTILGDGRVVPLVDAIALLSWIDNDPETPSGFLIPQREINQTDSSSRASKKKMIMVVDDSINVRRFLALTLEKADYRVEQAKDGQDAMEKIKGGIVPQAVICDIEMPRLDGFGFLSRIRAEAQHKKIPVIMLTSRSGEKHRKLAMNLGATDYFSKPFKEQELLSTLTRLIPN